MQNSTPILRRRATATLVVTSLVLHWIAVSGVPPAAAAVGPQSQSSVVSAVPAGFTPNITDGMVKSIVQVGNRMIVAGQFSTVKQCPARAGEAVLAVGDGLLDPQQPVRLQRHHRRPRRGLPAGGRRRGRLGDTEHGQRLGVHRRMVHQRQRGAVEEPRADQRHHRGLDRRVQRAGPQRHRHRPEAVERPAVPGRQLHGGERHRSRRSGDGEPVHRRRRSLRQPAGRRPPQLHTHQRCHRRRGGSLEVRHRTERPPSGGGRQLHLGQRLQPRPDRDGRPHRNDGAGQQRLGHAGVHPGLLRVEVRRLHARHPVLARRRLLRRRHQRRLLRRFVRGM